FLPRLVFEPHTNLPRHHFHFNVRLVFVCFDVKTCTQHSGAYLGGYDGEPTRSVPRDNKKSLPIPGHPPHSTAKVSRKVNGTVWIEPDQRSVRKIYAADGEV